MNKDRLMLVVKALEESKHPERFTMRYYIHVAPDQAEMFGLDPSVVGYEPSWCGTAACALGHLACRPDLQDFIYAEDCSMRYVTSARDGYKETAFWSDRELQEWFDLDLCYMRELFSERGCGEAKTTTEAIDYIKSFIEKHEHEDTSPLIFR